MTGEVCTGHTINTEKYVDQGKYKSVFNNTFSTSIEDLSLKVRSDETDFAYAA